MPLFLFLIKLEINDNVLCIVSLLYLVHNRVIVGVPTIRCTVTLMN